MPNNTATPAILVIDDDETLALAVKLMLEAEGYSVTLADDGDMGLRALDQQPFDLVITDIIMPEREGLETILTIGKRYPGLPVIAISGGGRNSAMKSSYLYMAQKMGAASTLQKPFSRGELIDAVKQYLSR